MPSLRMKSQSTTCCLLEKNVLSVCQKSTMISKSPLSRATIMQKAEAVETLIQSSQDASLWKEQCTHNSVRDETNNDELPDAEDPAPLKEESPSSFLPVSRMEFASATCSSSLETNIPSNQESVDISSESYAYANTGFNELNVPQLETDDSDDCSGGGGSCKYEKCSVPDSYFLDMLDSDLPVEGSSIYDDSIDAKFFHDFRGDDESTMFFDMTKEYMVMPFLEDTMNNGYAQDNGETMIASVDKSQAIHQVTSCNQTSNASKTLVSDQADCFDPQIFITNLADLPDVASHVLPALSTSEAQKSRSITLVLDLDETLVHSTLEPCEDADFTFPVFFNMKDHTVYVKQRPHLHAFLNRVAEMFEIVIFTASQSMYAKQLLDILDPDGKLISKRAYRESCVFSDSGYTKDLTILGVDLAKIAIIDNSPQVFQLQVNNGIPIESWFDDPSDRELLSLLPFLEILAVADDVRPIIAEKFGNKE